MRDTRTWIFSLLLLTAARCGEPKVPRYESPEGYNLENPFTIKLPLELDEISGITFYPKDSSVFAITDEYGYLYKIFLSRNSQIQKWKFSDDGDYEDVCLLDSVFYVLQSKGDLTVFTFDKNNTLSRKSIPFPLKGNEFEILYYDSGARNMKLLCKDCDADRKKSLIGFVFDPVAGVFKDSTFGINADAIARAIQMNQIKFKPSAAAINPVTHELFIISSINKLLTIADMQGHIKKTYIIDPRLFKQPEGMTFTPMGDLIVSNESGDNGVANILFFKYRRKKST